MQIGRWYSFYKTLVKPGDTVSLKDVVAAAWSLLWEKLVSTIPLPPGLSDFAVALALATLLALLYRLHRALFKVVLVLLWGVFIASIVFYYAGG
jgi:hypothetical protein